MLSFYSEVLPKRPAYDFIHYRNYFLISTIIVIILQDINFIRIKLYKRAQNININAISLRNMGQDKIELGKSDEYDIDRKFVKDAFADDAIIGNEQVKL